MVDPCFGLLIHKIFKLLGTGEFVQRNEVGSVSFHFLEADFHCMFGPKLENDDTDSPNQIRVLVFCRDIEVSLSRLIQTGIIIEIEGYRPAVQIMINAIGQKSKKAHMATL